MRQIKFRGKTLLGKVIYCEPFSFLPNSLFNFAKFCEMVDFDTVEQLIAVDKNGKEVYEGDLVKVNGSEAGFVSFHDGAFFAGGWLLKNYTDGEIEVIGHITEG